MRFRLSSTGGLAPGGLRADGEVEDYRVEIERPEDVIKWLQPPDLTPERDRHPRRYARRTAGGCWRTTSSAREPGLLTDVHFWGSWLRDAKAEIKKIHLSIHSDDPVGPGGSYPDNEYSMPDKLLWQMDFDRDAVPRAVGRHGGRRRAFLGAADGPT